MTPSDTNPAARHTPTTNHHPCTTKTGHGCRGYITDRTPDPATREAFHAGYHAGEDWALRGPHATPVHEAAEHAYTHWIEG